MGESTEKNEFAQGQKMNRTGHEKRTNVPPGKNERANKAGGEESNKNAKAQMQTYCHRVAG